MSRIHTYVAADVTPRTHTDIAPGTPLNEIVAVGSGSLAYGFDQDEALDVTKTVEELFGGGNVHVIVHSCREVRVTVTYGGSSRIVQAKPGWRVAKVRREAINAFQIDEASAAELVLRLPGSGEELPETDPIGGYAAEGTCSVALDLAPHVRAQG
ncbi:hypothetical protein OHB01_12620 [Microbispora hainanensis]|uniref:hypothetical protein n=1 Tax=Microbispora hainanensis TaxID=568844 RepID=UPI002E2CB96D|nr:hypothetical protein [Microbispora hainanensis]